MQWPPDTAARSRARGNTGFWRKAVVAAVMALLLKIKAAAEARGPIPVTQSDVADVRRRIPRDVVTPRLANIATPMLVMGRNQDDLNALFRATYEELSEAGKDVEWTVYDHDLHGYIFPLRGDDGEYAVDETQERAINEVVHYLDRYVRG